VTAATAGALLAFALGGVACRSSLPIGDAGPGGDGSGGSLKWYQTCGDPVCHTSTDLGPSTCGDAGVGASCAQGGAECDPAIGCNVKLRCTDTDPRSGPGGCPISRLAFKDDVEYVDDAGRERLRAELLSLPLATYRYKRGAPRRRLGFILDGHEASFAADPERDMVDLYGYTSMTVATVQAQAKQIAALEREVKRLGAELARRKR
jgi:hypothetical protein